MGRDVSFVGGGESGGRGQGSAWLHGGGGGGGRGQGAGGRGQGAGLCMEGGGGQTGGGYHACMGAKRPHCFSLLPILKGKAVLTFVTLA